jgi:alpha-D-xyloside xylohydrolase
LPFDANADYINEKVTEIEKQYNEEAMHWYIEDVWKKLIDMGIDGAKIDFCEEIPDHLPLKFADGRKPAGAHHWYPTLYNVFMYKLFNSRPEGGMCFSRGGGIGAQRYPFIWAGDQIREYFFLKNMLISVLSSGMSGIPFMSYDMAAYRPARDLTLNPEANVFIRGLEYTAFSANIQTHGLVTRPYDFDEHTKDVYRAYAKLHDAIRPYLIEQGDMACETGMPLMRHLFLYDPSDANVYDIEDEYMLGDALLVAPVLDAVNERDIYLPKGTWQNIFTGEEFEGGQTLESVQLPLEAVAVFKLKDNASKKIDEALEAAAPFIRDINTLRFTAK